MNSSPRPYLKVARLQSTQRGISSTSSCSTLTHSTGPIPSGKSNTSGSLNGAVVCQPPSSQITGGLRHSSIVVHIENDGAKISLPLSSVTTRLAPSRVPSSSISENRWSAAYRANTSDRPGSTPIPQRARRPAPSQRPAFSNCSSPSLTPHSSYGARRVRAGQAHRHVEVVGAGGVRPVEDRHVEDRVDGVHDMRDPVLLAERGHRLRRRGVDLRRHEAVVAERLDRLRRAAPVVVGDHAELEEVAPRRDPGEGGSDAAGADQKDSHNRQPLRRVTTHRCTTSRA